MVRNTGDSEDHQSYRTDKRIREMWFHLNTAGSTTYTLQQSRRFYGQKYWRLRGSLVLQSRQWNQSNVVSPLYSWFNYLHTLISQVFLWLETLEAPRIAGTIEWIIESEQCSSPSIQLVQLPKPSNIPGVSMVRNTGDSEDCWNYRMDNKIRAMQFHLYTAGLTPYTL